MTQVSEAPLVEQLITDMVESRKAQLLADVMPRSKQPYFYLSGLHTCPRNLYYLLADGEKQAPFNEYTLALFESGKQWEKMIVAQLLTLGFEWVKAQEVVEIKYAGKLKAHHGEVIGRGKIDGKIKYKGTEFPAEIKTMGQYAFDAIETVDDLMGSEFTEKYLRQLLCYLYGHEKEAGLFILSDCRGHLKLIPVYLGNHLEIAEMALRNMEKAWEAKIAKEPPDRIEYHHKICGKCAFNPICLPGEVIEGGDAIDDPEIESLLERHERLAPSAKEYDDAHESVKDLFKDRAKTTVSGRFIVTPSKRMRTSYDTKQLTPEQREEIKVETPFTVVNVEEIKS